MNSRANLHKKSSVFNLPLPRLRPPIRHQYGGHSLARIFRKFAGESELEIESYGIPLKLNRILLNFENF